jgi:hypothetical protein
MVIPLTVIFLFGKINENRPVIRETIFCFAKCWEITKHDTIVKCSKMVTLSGVVIDK